MADRPPGLACEAMTADLVALCVRAHDPDRLAQFWFDLLGGNVSHGDPGGPVLEPAEDPGFELRFVATAEPKIGPNKLHFDLTSTSLEHQHGTVEKALSLGARHVDVGQGPEEGHVVLADPESNEFCVLEPGNRFLAGCGFIGALNCDGSQRVGYFWSAALGWPLVWDQDQETAIRSPTGGPKVTWSGPPLLPRTGPNRLSFVLAPTAGNDRDAEVNRLLAEGATLVHLEEPRPGQVILADPDGNEFSVVDRR